MALTRKFLKSMGLNEEQIDSVIEAHTETVDALKTQLTQYKDDAEKYAEAQKQLGDLKNGTVSKAEYDKLKNEFDGYKADVDSKEKLSAVKAAYRKLLEDQKIGREDADLIMAATHFDGMKLGDDGGLENADKLTSTIKESYKRYIPTVETHGSKVETPPKSGGDSGANSRAAEIARQRHERMYGKAPTNEQK